MLLYLYKFSCFCYLANALLLQYILINEALLRIAIVFFTSIIACVLIFIIFYFIRRKAKSKKRKKLREYFGNIISEIAICESISERQAGIEAGYGIAKTVSLTNVKLNTPIKRFTEWLRSLKNNHSEKMPESEPQIDTPADSISENSPADIPVFTKAMAAVMAKESFLQEVDLKPGFYKLLQSPFVKSVFIRQLIKASKNMAGSANENLKWLYEHLHLEKDSEIRIKNKKWHIKAKAIQELAQMEQKKYVKQLYKLANDSNTFVRQEAQTAIVKLFGFSGLRFLNVISYTISDWQQFCLLQELSLKRITSFAGVEKWIRSANDSVVIFALRLVETYHWHELHDDVAAQLTHPSEKVQQKAIQTLGEIYKPNTAGFLIAAYHKINKPLQFVVLKVFQKAATQNEVPFLLDQLKHPDNQFKLMAARAIHNCSADNTDIIRDTIINNGYSAAALLSQLLEEEIV